MDKKKLTVGFSLVLLSGLAAVSGTFAWFGTNRTAFISFTDATIRSRSGNLNVKYIKSFNTMEANEKTDAFGDALINLTVDKSVEEAKYVTDISGHGLDFYKTSWSGLKNTNNTRLEGESQFKAGQIDEIEIKEAGDADGFFIDFTLEISRDNKGSDHGLLVYLGNGTRILPKVENLSDFEDTLDKDDNVIESAYAKYYAKQLKNINATKAARLAVNDLDDYPLVEVGEDEDPYVPTPKTKFIYAQDPERYKESDTETKYMGLVEYKDVDGNPVKDKSAYGLTGSHALEDILAVREGYVQELGTSDSAKGKVITLLGDNNSDDDVRYDFVSGFASYQNFKQVSEVLKDDEGDPLDDWMQPLNHGLIADLSTDNNTVEYVNFRMWIEGSDVNAREDVVGGIFTLELDIYTVEVLKN